MKVKEVDSRLVWEDHWRGMENKTFLQSWNWAQFQRSQGRKVWCLGVYDNGLVNAALVEKVEARRGTFLLVPHGPSTMKGFGLLTERLRELARKEKACFIRISSIWNREQDEPLIEEGFRDAPIHVHPEASWVLDLIEEDLLMDMRKSTRYNIRKALEDDDINVRKGGAQDMKLFSEMHKETAKRHSFVPFSESYLLKEFESFGDEVTLYVVEYKGKIGAMAFVIFWSNYGFYHHAVLDLKLRDEPLSYRILWQAIQDTKSRGGSLFDFWGYADPESNHPWAGPTLFKMGFGGYKKEYVRTKDLVTSPRYWLNYGVESIRRIKRGF